MIARFVSALIIDQDKTSARNMGNLVQELFNKVFTQSDLKLIMGDMEDIRPSVVLINLGIAQRTENLEIADHLGSLPNVPLLLGYADSHEPELIAHALESGFQDLFMKPFDQDIIASKINKFYQHEKTLKHDLHYIPLRPALSAKVNMQIKVVGCDENGITLLSEHYVSKGTTFKLPAPLSQDITANAKTEFMITRTWTGDSWSQYFSYAELKVPDETKNSALRRFILGQTN